ncbi:MAG: hypothetical protein P4L98_05755 [Ancalomicrobiaceae bacterium]|nr:hypothetical protein [Ancalomicrobiaceae bacterium]
MHRLAKSLIAAALGPSLMLLPAAAAAAPPAPNLGFVVQVSLTPKAAAKLAEIHEKIKVSAYWYGEPSKSAPKREISEVGQVVLGSEDVQLPGSGGVATITGKTARADHLDWLLNREVSVNVNVYTARLADKNNLLDCELVEDIIVKLQTKPNPVKCKLIGEK